MADKPPAPPFKPPYALPPNCRDVTAERAGVMFGIVGADHLRKTPAPSPAPAPDVPEKK